MRYSVPTAAVLACAAVFYVRATIGGEEDAANLDVVRPADGTKPLLGKVTRDDYLFVEVQTRFGKPRRPSYAVQEVLRGDRVPEYDRALEARDQERYTVAARWFRAALEKMADRSWAAEYCNFGIAEALRAAAHYDPWKGRTYTYQAPAAYYALAIEANPKSRFILAAMAKRADCLVKQESVDLDNAHQALTAAQARVQQYREEIKPLYDLAWLKAAERAETMLLWAAAQLEVRRAEQAAVKDYGPALAACRSAVRAAQKDHPDIFAEAAAEEVRLLFKAGRTEEATARADQLIRECENTPARSDVAAAAYAMLGKIRYADALHLEGRGQAAQAQTAYADARWNFLKTLVQFPQAGEGSEETLRLVVVCYEKLSGQETDAAVHAARYRGELLRLFPNSANPQRPQ